jgi:2,4-dienoyl-CoA reductase-like NADH-dependent reductase (Old Yellow Enzyme family)
MVEGLCSVLTGEPNEAHYRLYKTWAEAGFGMVISGACGASVQRHKAVAENLDMYKGTSASQMTI